MANPDVHTAVTPLKDKRVLVTGGTTGIGRAIARLLAAYGARLFIFGRHAPELGDALKAVRADGGEIEGMTADAAKPKDVDRVFARVRKHFGALDILVDNAGLAGEGVAEMSDADWRYVVETNLTAYMAFAKDAAAWMEERGEGDIVLVGSMSAVRRGKDSSVYVATKAGVQGFAESLHKEMAEKGIRVSLIEPGRVGADMDPLPPRAQRAKIRKMEMLRAEDIAVAVHYVLTQPKRCAIPYMQVRPLIEPGR
jgi:NAD(P)-dependent dehydrogenase (short-subunit alcohol dehydrogenase family)